MSLYNHLTTAFTYFLKHKFYWCNFVIAEYVAVYCMVKRCHSLDDDEVQKFVGTYLEAYRTKHKRQSVDNGNQKQKKKKDEDNRTTEKRQSANISGQKQKEKNDSEDENENDWRFNSFNFRGVEVSSRV